MTNRENAQPRKKPVFQKVIYSLRRILLDINKIPGPIFLLLLIGFSSLYNSTAHASLTIVQAAIPATEETRQTNAYVQPTFLAMYPSDRYSRGLGFAMRDNYIYSIIGYNPTVIDVSNRSAPTFVAEYIVGNGRMCTLALQDNYLYLGSSLGLEILNISDFNSITKVGQCNTTGAVMSIVLQDDIAYLAASSNGLVIVNVSDPTHPVEVGCFNDGGSAWDLALKGSLAFVTDTETTLEIINIGDPQNPIKVSHYKDEVYDDLPGSSITLNGSYAYLGTFRYGLFILDITNSSHLERVGHYYGGTKPIGEKSNDESVRGIFVKEQYIFEAVGSNGFYVLDVRDSSNPVSLGQFTGFYFLFGLYLHETCLYLQTLFEGIVILNLTFHRGYPPGTFRGLILTLIFVPIGCGLIALPFIIEHNKKRRRELWIQSYTIKK